MIELVMVDTALRDIQQLVERGVLVRSGAGGRSTSYALTDFESL
jgi:Fic family protein